jgi:hypothetical protein
MPTRVRLMDEYSSIWPLWLDDRGQDTADVLAISARLAEKLRDWAKDFDEGFDVDDGWDDSTRAENHALEGDALASEVQNELGTEFNVELILIR